MFFIVWGWARRVTNLGFVGPYTCTRCGWVGTFWLVLRERRLKVYWIAVGRWKPTEYMTVCRNCQATSAMSVEQGAALAASVTPLDQPDPFGPAQAPPPVVPAPSNEVTQPEG